MKFKFKLFTASAVLLLGISPVAVSGLNPSFVQAAKTAAVHPTKGKNSRIRVTRTVKMVNNRGKAGKRKAVKGSHYTIWDVRRIKGVLYYSIQSNLRYWLPASATKGTVQYKEGQKTIRLLTNGTTTYTKQTLIPAKRKAKKAAPKKKQTKVAKAKQTKTKKQAHKAVPIVSVAKKAYVYNVHGQRVKSYQGSKKYTSMIAGVKVNSLGTKTIKGQKYYALQPNRYYVKASDFKVIK